MIGQNRQEANAKRCDLCGGGDFELISRRDRRGGELLTDLCTSCGLVSHHEIPSESDLFAFYATQYRQQYHGEITPSARRVVRAWGNGERLFRAVSPFLAKQAEVLEIGAGIGCTVKVFEQNGFAASGIEPNEGFQRFAARQLRARVSRATLEDLSDEARYDAILLIHVIEHLRSPRESLLRMHRLLRPEGLLYVECPNLAGPFARRSKLFHYAHIYNFTPQTLEVLAGRCGYSVERWASDERDPNLAVLLRRQEQAMAAISPGGCAATREALGRYNALTYHLRLNYLAPRIVKLASYAWEHATAARRMRRILANPVPAGSPTPGLKGTAGLKGVR